MDKAPLMIDYYSIGHIECTSVRWERNSVYPILLLDLSITVRPYGERNLPVTLFSIEGEVALEDNKIIGRAFPINNPLLFSSGKEGSKGYATYLRIDLDLNRVTLMENYRMKGKPKLKINLYVVAFKGIDFGKGNTTIIVEMPEEKWQEVKMHPEIILGEDQELSIGTLFNQYSLKKGTANAEKKLILEVLSKTNWNRRKTAELLEISYRSLLYKLKEYKITE